MKIKLKIKRWPIIRRWFVQLPDGNWWPIGDVHDLSVRDAIRRAAGDIRFFMENSTWS